MDTEPTRERQPFVVHMPSTVKLTRKQFWEVCRANPDWQLERTAEGDIVVLPPAGGETGARNLELAVQLGLWAKADGTGVGFDSSTGFELPNGATRSPDVAWVLRSRLARLSAREKERFLPLCPDFVIELRSATDPLALLQDKMREYIANGARLGWLIDPASRRVYVYRPDAAVDCLENPTTLSGDPVLPGFVLDLASIWQPNV